MENLKHFFISLSGQCFMELTYSFLKELGLAPTFSLRKKKHLFCLLIIFLCLIIKIILALFISCPIDRDGETTNKIL